MKRPAGATCRHIFVRTSATFTLKSGLYRLLDLNLVRVRMHFEAQGALRFALGVALFSHQRPADHIVNVHLR